MLLAHSLAMAAAYHLTLDSNFKATRDGAIGDNVIWVVEKNGSVILSRNAAGELEFRNSSNVQGASYRIWLKQFVGGSYQQVSNIVEYTPGTTNQFALSLSPGYKINRSGALGNAVTWVIEMDGNIVLQRYAANELSYTYYRNWAGTKFRVWLKKYINGQYRVVSNIVEYQPNQSAFNLTLDQKYKLTRNGQPGDQVRWIVEQNGLIIENRDASNEMSYTFVNSQPGAHYQMWLQKSVNGSYQTVSNVIAYDEPAAYDVDLALGPDYELSRSGNLGDDLTWVIIKNGTHALSRGAYNELSYTYFGNSTDSYIEAYLEQWGNGYYQRVSNVVRYAVTANSYTLNVDAQFQLTRSGAYGEPLFWIIEQDGQRVQQEDASQGLFYTYPGNTPGASYRAWLAMEVDGTVRPVSNAVSYAVPSGGTTPPPPTTEHSLILLDDYTILRNDGPGEMLEWVVEENGMEVWRSDATFQDEFRFPFHVEGNTYRVWLVYPGKTEPQSNIISYVFGAPGFNYSIQLNADDSIRRNGAIGDEVDLVFVQNGIIVGGMDASQELVLHPYFPSGSFQAYLIPWGGQEGDPISNTLDIVIP